jgi:hypothetical protein
MNLTNQELNNDDRNAEAAELVRDFANLFRFISSTSSSSSIGSSRCPDGYDRSPDGDCEGIR